MKTTHLIALIVIAASLAVIVTTYNSDITTYGNFTQSAEGKTVKLIGQLVKEKPVEYNPEVNTNHLAFYLRDDQGDERKVILRAAKPQDFERSEQIVLTGSMQNGVFMADDMQLKCPSKYKDEETYIRGQASN